MSDTLIKLREDIKSAMKARESEKLGVLRLLNAAVKQVEIDTRKELKEEDVLSILQKEVKKRRDSLKFAKEAKREDLVSQNLSELEIIQAYLGEELSEKKLEELINKLVAEGANNIGAIMGALNREHKGLFDGKLASSIAKSKLS